MTIIARIIALALALGLTGQADIWEQPRTQDTEATHIATIPADQIDPIDDTCLTVDIVNHGNEQYQIVTKLDTYKGVQVGLEGQYLQYAFDQRGLDTRDMTISSIDITGKDQVIICPGG